MFDANTIDALSSGAAVLRDILVVRGHDAGGDPAVWSYWTGEDNITINLVPAGADTPVSHNLVGGGMLRDVPQIVDAIGVSARSVTFGLDHISTVSGSPMDMVFGNNVRTARVELHRAVFSAETYGLVSTPFLVFSGRVDGIEVDDAAAGGEGGLRLTAVQAAIDLTRTNSAMKSDAQQQLRGGDRYRRYSAIAGQIQIARFWGQAKGAA